MSLSGQTCFRAPSSIRAATIKLVRSVGCVDIRSNVFEPLQTEQRALWGFEVLLCQIIEQSLSLLIFAPSNFPNKLRHGAFFLLHHYAISSSFHFCLTHLNECRDASADRRNGHHALRLSVINLVLTTSGLGHTLYEGMMYHDHNDVQIEAMTSDFYSRLFECSNS